MTLGVCNSAYTGASRIGLNADSWGIRLYNGVSIYFLFVRLPAFKCLWISDISYFGPVLALLLFQSSDARFSGAVHNSARTPFLNQWKMGDRVGIHLDLKKKELSVYKNGQGVGVAFSGLNATESLYPVLSLCHGSQVTIQKAKASKDSGGNVIFVPAS